MSLDSKIEYISKLLSINIDELKSINQEVIQQAYDYLISLKEFEDNDDITENQRSEVIASRNETKNQLETRIKENKDDIKRSSEHLDVQSGKSTIEIGQDSAPAPQIDSDERRKQIFEKSKKIILDHFLDLFYNFFITYEEKWKKASDDVKKKDYFRYLREKLADVIDENGTIQSLGSMSEDKKIKVRQIIKNSFIDEKGNDLIPPIYNNTYAMDSYLKYINEIMYPATAVGGKKRQKLYTKHTHTRRIPHSHRRSHYHRHRRTSRK